VKILVLNAGSSSLKWKLYDMPEQLLLASGLIEGIGEEESSFELTYQDTSNAVARLITNHKQAFQLLFEALRSRKIIDIHNELSAVGHRVVHGGERFNQPTLITGHILEELHDLSVLAPLHNPANILGIETMMSSAPHILNIAIFDTAFHQSMPKHAFLYALPEALYTDLHIRRYGFHGTSHHYVANTLAKRLMLPLAKLNIITLHLGNGASACAIKNGKSVDTSMGFTPLEGLVMGTRSGDLDPAILTYLMDQKGLSSDDINTLLNKQSGLKGLCQENDLRSIIKRSEENDTQAKLALEIFTYRIKKYIGAYIAVLGRVDAIVFTGGIGEHAPIIREMVLKGFDETFDIYLDKEKNQHPKPNAIHQKRSRIQLHVIKTNEELQIALEVAKVLKSS
jgi:acetate kinase